MKIEYLDDLIGKIEGNLRDIKDRMVLKRLISIRSLLEELDSGAYEYTVEEIAEELTLEFCDALYMMMSRRDSAATVDIGSGAADVCTATVAEADKTKNTRFHSTMSPLQLYNKYSVHSTDPGGGRSSLSAFQVIHDLDRKKRSCLKDGEMLLGAFYNHFKDRNHIKYEEIKGYDFKDDKEKKKLTNPTLIDYISRIKLFAKVYLPEMIDAEKIVRGGDDSDDDVIFIYDNIEYIIPRFDVKVTNDNGKTVTDKKRLNIRSALNKLKTFKCEWDPNR